jgi:DNA-binding transcriptional LysR family regulator
VEGTKCAGRLLFAREHLLTEFDHSLLDRWIGQRVHDGGIELRDGEAIAGLEHAFGVRLLDRNPQGVTPTIYGRAVLRRSLAVFDELKQSSRDIESLSDPRSGEVRIGSAESITATFLSLAIQHFSERFPRVVLHVDDVPARVDELAGLRDRRYDLVLLDCRSPLPMASFWKTKTSKCSLMMNW